MKNMLTSDQLNLIIRVMKMEYDIQQEYMTIINEQEKQIAMYNSLESRETSKSRMISKENYANHTVEILPTETEMYLSKMIHEVEYDIQQEHLTLMNEHKIDLIRYINL